MYTKPRIAADVDTSPNPCQPHRTGLKTSISHRIQFISSIAPVRTCSNCSSPVFEVRIKVKGKSMKRADYLDLSQILYLAYLEKMS